MISNESPTRLHLGCGLNAPADWVNLDGSWQVEFARRPRLKAILARLGIYPRRQSEIAWPRNIRRWDLRKPLPFQAETFTAVYSSHTFEHLYRNEAAALARECWRVLRPGGVCRLVVPDLRAITARYLRGLAEESPSLAAETMLEELLMHPSRPARGPLGFFHRFTGFHQHKWMYDSDSLGRLMVEAGFAEVTPRPCRLGLLPGLEQIEDPTRLEDGAGIAVEGIKPGAPL